MSEILLETLIKDLNEEQIKYLNSKSEVRQSCNEYLHDLFSNHDLLSIDSYTTTTVKDKKEQTLAEEIAELGLSQRKLGQILGDLSNKNRNLIIQLRRNLSLVNDTICSQIEREINTTGKIITQELHTKSEHHSSNIFQNLSGDGVRKSISTNKLILCNVDSVLDFLELPALCKFCVLQGNYQEALEVSILAEGLLLRFPKFEIFRKIYEQTQNEIALMMKRLIKLLNADLKQHTISKIFQTLNRLEFFASDTSNSSEVFSIVDSSQSRPQKDKFLKLAFLNGRFKFITSEVENLSPFLKFNKVTYLKRYIEIYREHIFGSLSIYHSLFATPVVSLKHQEVNSIDQYLTSEFVRKLATLLSDDLVKLLPQIRNNQHDSLDSRIQVDGLVLQIIYLCKSLLKYNQDFENILLGRLVYANEPILAEKEWLTNLGKVKKIRS